MGGIGCAIYLQNSQNNNISANEFYHIKNGTTLNVDEWGPPNGIPYGIYLDEPSLKNYIERTNRKFGVSSTKEKFSEGGVTIKGVKIIFRIEQELKIGTILIAWKYSFSSSKFKLIHKIKNRRIMYIYRKQR